MPCTACPSFSHLQTQHYLGLLFRSTSAVSESNNWKVRGGKMTQPGDSCHQWNTTNLVESRDKRPWEPIYCWHQVCHHSQDNVALPLSSIVELTPSLCPHLEELLWGGSRRSSLEISGRKTQQASRLTQCVKSSPSLTTPVGSVGPHGRRREPTPHKLPSDLHTCDEVRARPYLCAHRCINKKIHISGLPGRSKPIVHLEEYLKSSKFLLSVGGD